MGDSVIDRVKRIANDLAKKDMHYIESEDKDNQDKLKKVLFRSAMNEDIIKQKLENIINDLDKNPEFEVTADTRKDVLIVMEQHITAGNLQSISQINDKQFIAKAVTNRIIQEDRAYRKDVSDMLSNYSLKGEQIIFSSYMISCLMNGELSKEKLENLSNIIENSEQVKMQKVNSVESIINGTELEKAASAMYLSSKEAGGNCKYFIEHQDNKATRGAIFIVLRKASLGEPMLLQEAMVKAAQFGLNDLINPDGTINMDRAYERFSESISGDKRLMERFSSKEKFLQEVQAANQRGADNKGKEYSKDEQFIAKWNNCKDDKERSELLVTRAEEKKAKIERLRIEHNKNNSNKENNRSISESDDDAR